MVRDQLFFDCLQTAHKEFFPLCHYATYAEILRSCDLVLLPLEATDITRCKSDLGLIDAAAHGVVALASPTVYAASIQDGATGMVFRSTEEFTQRLRQLVTDPRYGNAWPPGRTPGSERSACWDNTTAIGSTGTCRCSASCRG